MFSLFQNFFVFSAQPSFCDEHSPLPRNRPGIVISATLLSGQFLLTTSPPHLTSLHRKSLLKKRDLFAKIFQVPESLSTDGENPNYRLTLPVKRTYVLHRGPNGEPRWWYYSDIIQILFRQSSEMTRCHYYYYSIVMV